VQVDAQAPVAMFLNSPSGVSPSVWTTSLTVPAAATSTLLFVAQDELFFAGQPGSADHTATLQTAPLNILAGPAMAPAAPTATLGGVDLTGKWVPLNAGPISLTGASSEANVASVQFLNGTNLIGSSSPGKPLVLLPPVLANGAVSLTACPVDVAGQQGPCSPAVAFTIGAIPVPTAAPLPILGKAADGSRSIFFLNAAGNLLAQPFDQISPTPAAPGTQISSDAFVLASLFPTPEATGVYALKSDGSAVERFDCGALTLACSKPTFVMPPTAASFSTIPIITSAAMLLQDANGMPFLARALPSQTTDAAVPAGGAQALDASNNPLRGTSKSGAIALGLTSGTSALINLFHPALTSANHLFPLLAPRANTTLTDLEVFPGGEIVFQFFDTTTKQAYLGAALFDGTSQPQVLAPFPVGPAAGGFLASGFLVAKPGVVLGGVPASGALNGNDIQPIELSLGVGAQQFSPAVDLVGSTTGTGPLCASCIEDRYGGLATFSVSDDGTKALFATADSKSTILNLHLLDLATGIAPVIGGSSLLFNSSRFPRFVHAAAVYSGGPATGMVPAVVWSEQLNNSTTAHSDERLFFATWSASGPGAPVNVDRLAGSFSPSRNAAGDAVAESASAQELFFLSQRPQGGADLYAVSLTGASGVAAKVADRVFWYSIREDKARILVARTDGTLLSAQLTPGVDLATALQPVLEGGPTGEANYTDNLYSFGFTPDGDHAYLATNQSFSSGSGVFNGVVETVDLTSGARANFGRTSWPSQNFDMLFLDQAKAAYLADGFDVQDSAGRIAYASASVGSSGTVHRDTGLFPNGFSPSIPFSYILSADLTEAILTVGFVFTSNRGPGEIRIERAGSGIAQEDGTFLPIGGAFFPREHQVAQIVPSPLGGVLSFGPGQAQSPQLFDWTMINRAAATNHPQGTVLKVLGGGKSPAPIIQISNGFTLPGTPSERTPDNKELLVRFADPFSSGTSSYNGYVMDVAISGHAPPTLAVP